MNGVELKKKKKKQIKIEKELPVHLHRFAMALYMTAHYRDRIIDRQWTSTCLRRPSLSNLHLPLFDDVINLVTCPAVLLYY